MGPKTRALGFPSNRYNDKKGANSMSFTQKG